MKKTKNNNISSVLLTIMMVLFFASCTGEDLLTPEQPSLPQGMKAVTVDFQMPESKPAFHEKGQSRAATGWGMNDELLMVVRVTGMVNGTLTPYVSYISLTYDGAAWDVMPDKSGTAIGNNTSGYSYVMLTQTENIDLDATGGIGVLIPEDMTLAGGRPTIYLYYAPEMEMSLTHGENGTATGIGNRTLKEGALTTAPEAWYLESNAGWKTDQARLRIYTGKAGDKVTLQGNSYNYYPGSVDQTNDGIYTATTDANGDAYFYGSMEKQTGDFTISLTAISGVSLTTPVTLLEATSLVPVTLEAGKAYMLDATAKRTEAAADSANQPELKS